MALLRNSLEAPQPEISEEAARAIETSSEQTREAIQELRESNHERIRRLAWLGELTRRLNELEVESILEG